MSKVTEDQIKRITDILNEDGSNRGAAKEVLGCTSKESTIRRMRKKGLIKLDHEDKEGLEMVPLEVLDELIEASDDLDLVQIAKRLRSAQKANSQLRKIQRGFVDGGSILEEIFKGVSIATDRVSARDTVYLGNMAEALPEARGATLEVLFSDLQIGKVSRHYNTKVAKLGCADYGKQIIEAINSRKSMYRVEAIVFAMIGDVVEDHLKHGVSSSISTDTGLAEQMADAIEAVWTGILEPMAKLGIPMKVICVTGNHGSSMHKGMDSFKAGRFSYDYVIHKTLESYCKILGMDHVSFDIPEGTFACNKIYGKYAIYEHGYHNNFTEKGMTDQMLKRGQQLEKHVSYWRQGDKHHHTCFGQGQQVLNGAFFGIDQEGLEYSGVLGFNSIPSQTIMFHVDEKTLGKCNIKDIVNIQLSQC